MQISITRLDQVLAIGKDNHWDVGSARDFSSLFSEFSRLFDVSLFVLNT
jgi:hypothetical protein